MYKLLTLVLGTLFGSQAKAVDMFLAGRVVDEAGKPLITASVNILTVARPLILVPEPVRSDGSFKIRVDQAPKAPLRSEVSAPGYASVTRNVLPLTEGTQDLGIYVLRRLPTLEIGRPELVVAGNNTQVFLDVFITNKSKSSIELRSFKVTGSARESTGCLDMSAATTLQLDKFLPDGKLAVAAILGEKLQQMDSVVPKGGVELLPCGQCRLNVSIPLLANIPAGQLEKLRFTMPRIVKVDGFKCVPLDDWALLSLSAITADGTEVKSSR
jgi:hypothetical protein